MKKKTALDSVHLSHLMNPRTDVAAYPVGSNVAPVAVVWIENKEIKIRYAKRWSGALAKAFSEFLLELKEKNIPYKVIGVWPGQWSSDFFEFGFSEIQQALHTLY